MRSILLLIIVACGAAACAHQCPPAAQAAPAAAAAKSSGSPSVAARIGDRDVTLAEVDAAAARQLYEARETALDRLIDEQVVGEAAKRAGKPISQFLDEKAAAIAPEATHAEAKDFYDRNKDRLPEQLAGKPFAEIEPILIRGLTEQRRREATGAVIESLRQDAHVKVLLEAPRVSVAATGPARGPAGAKVTIVEFSDFQCPYCARARPVLEQVMKQYGSDVRLVFRDFPLSFHDNAAKAAEAGHCADEQGRFWAMHDWMFENQSKLTVSELKDAAPGLGIDRKKFDQCLDSGKYGDVVTQNERDGEKAGVSGTPAFFIDGEMLSGAQPFEKFKAAIDRALARGKN
jgi:protein-disulfide isomerase